MSLLGFFSFSVAMCLLWYAIALICLCFAMQYLAVFCLAMCSLCYVFVFLRLCFAILSAWLCPWWAISLVGDAFAKLSLYFVASWLVWSESSATRTFLI